ncbi:MAG: tetratricopeptide repeat protein [Sedimentisphaerales bacterium]|nr:tetratricopeptide repeat protein [Sedimentisphaerales bacterium]
MTNLQPKYRVPLLCALLAVVTFAVYLPVRNHEFVNYDDDDYVTDNPNIKSGFSWQNFKWAFTTGRSSNWHPLTWLSLMLDCTLFGVKSGPLHLINVVFHITNTLLLFVVFNRMTKRSWASAFIAALFAVHPLHVESVAWVAERKDVLSTLFWLLTMLAYIRYTERKSIIAYITAIVLFGLGLMAKPMLVTLPFVLILLDYWPLSRFLNSKFSILNSIIEKLPFFILTIVSSVITFIFQRKGGAVTAIFFKDRILNALCSYLAYIWKMFVPTRLAVLYPHPASISAGDGMLIVKAVVSAIILILITALLLYYGRRYKYLAFGWLWYLGTLVPVIGIIQVGVQAMADRYTYIPLIGLFVIIAFGAADLLKHIPLSRRVLSTMAAVVLLACVLSTSAQLKHWQTSLTLFEHALAVTKNNYTILNNYGNSLSDQDRPYEAVIYFNEAIKILPNAPDIRNNFGVALKKLDRIDDAIEQYNIALRLEPNYAVAHLNLGVALMAKGEYDAAIEHYKFYLGCDANDVNLQQGMAISLATQGKVGDAVGRFKKALAARPDSAEVLGNLGYALAQSGKPGEALEYYYRSLLLDPNNIITHGRLALALAAVGKIDESIEQCRIVLAARPDDAEMHTNLGILLQAKGKFDQAVESYKKALQFDPNDQKARENLNALTQNTSTK